MTVGPDVAPDGSPVELYLLLPARGEGEIVAQAVEPGSSILELGCGVGRMTHQLVERGFRVTAVDESEAMLAHVHGAETVHAPIERLDLGRRFEAVLLASNLLSDDPPQRRAFLETCVRHADLAVYEHEAAGRRWTHPFAMRVFASDEELEVALAEAGLSFDRWLDRGRGWFTARVGRAPR